ncbi:MAG: cytochrome c3 family protein [Desulfobacterales bacterium]
MKAKAIAVLVIGLLMTAAVSLAVENKGAKEISLFGGKSGNVPFPHHRHQETIGDCKICHGLFPQQAGIIRQLKAEGKLKKKHVMNKLCTKCHKQKKKAGEKSGPVTCKSCHIKE